MAGKGRAEGCASCAKWLLIIFNVLFCLIGIGLIATGVYAYVELRDYLNVLGDSRINAPAIVLIVFGCITLLIAAIGCLGAIKESSCLLFTFAAIILVLLIAEIGAGIAAFVYRNQIEDFFDDTVANATLENPAEAVKKSWDVVQKTLNCCGYNGASDYPNGPPDSCGSHTVGCKKELLKTVEKNIHYVGAVGVAFGVIELLGIVLACILGCQARKGESV